jgi:hypothetical protein
LGSFNGGSQIKRQEISHHGVLSSPTPFVQLKKSAMKLYTNASTQMLLALAIPGSIAFTVGRNERRAWAAVTNSNGSCNTSRRPRIVASAPDVVTDEEAPPSPYVDEDAPADVEGYEFFGSNTRKAEFYDPVAENNLEAIETVPFDRFADHAIGRRLQDAMNALDESIYASNCQWETIAPWKEQGNNSRNPIAALKSASNFYRDMKFAIVSADAMTGNDTASTTTTYRVRWEMAVVWPIFWEPPVVLTGESLCTLRNDDQIIVRQVDSLDEGGHNSKNGDSLAGSLVRQIVPRFWDVYHLGITPVAEDRLMLASSSGSSPLKPYQIRHVPPRWVRCITMRDTSDRSCNAAAYLPNQAFTSFLKTVGPMKETYGTVRGVSIELAAVQVVEQGNNSGQRQQQSAVDITWKIPLSVAYGAKPVWDLVADPDTEDSYELQHAKTYAVIGYGGWGPQDSSVSAVRQKLFEAAVADGNKPALTASGRPKFGFFDRTIKACYKETGGLSMVVYEWRPRWTDPYLIYLELENTVN